MVGSKQLVVLLVHHRPKRIGETERQEEQEDETWHRNRGRESTGREDKKLKESDGKRKRIGLK